MASAPNKRHSRFAAFESLSPRGQAVVIDGLEQDLPQETIRMRLAEATSEDFSRGSISRYAVAWRTQRAIEDMVAKQTDRFVEGIKAHEAESLDTGSALIFQAILETANETGELDVDKLHKLNIRYNMLRQDQQELEIKRAALAVKEQALAIATKRVALLEAKIAEVRTKAQAIEQAASRFSEIPAELRSQVRELFGLASEEANAA